MPKGLKTITTGYTTFHRCVCGYDIEDVSKKLIEMKKKLHRKKCQEWNKEDVGRIDVGILDLPRGMNQHQVNRDANRQRNELQQMVNVINRQ
jgi:hypothetical protein